MSSPIITQIVEQVNDLPDNLLFSPYDKSSCKNQVMPGTCWNL
jgi:hypothetical protein